MTDDEILSAYDKAVAEYDEATKKAHWYKPLSHLGLAEKRKAYEALRGEILKRLGQHD